MWEPELANPDMLIEPVEDEDTREMAELIREGMELLSVQQRRVVEVMAEGRTFEETARLLSMSPSTLRNHLRRARKKIQEHVTQNLD